MAVPRLCSVDDCDKPCINLRGWCSKHYARWRRYGEPLGRPPTKPRGVCSIDGCAKPVKALGYCNAHYLRHSRHGSPLAGSTDWGAVPQWLDEVAIPYVGDDCLPFPYSKDRHGYGRVNLNRKYVGAHIYVAERCLGKKPTPAHEVCHSCGKGHEACVTPRHLYWGTRRDNVRDAIRDGTFSPPPRKTKQRG